MTVDVEKMIEDAVRWLEPIEGELDQAQQYALTFARSLKRVRWERDQLQKKVDYAAHQVRLARGFKLLLQPDCGLCGLIHKSKEESHACAVERAHYFRQTLTLFRKAAEKFVDKCETGKAYSKESYREFKEALSLLAEKKI